MWMVGIFHHLTYKKIIEHMKQHYTMLDEEIPMLRLLIVGGEDCPKYLFLYGQQERQ